MTRALILFVFVVVLATATVVVWELSGTVVVTTSGYQSELPIGMAALLLLVVFFALFIVVRLVTLMIGSPRKIQSFMGKRRQERGYTALSRGMLAVAAGDAAEAQRYAKRAKSLLDDPPLTLLLAAQAAQLGGNEKSAETYFTAMLENGDTEFLGLRGLFMQARRQGDMETALGHAQRAFQLRPNTPWVVNALLDLQTQTGKWIEAADTLGTARRFNLLTDDVERRRRAVLLTAQARDLADEQSAKALDRVMAALRLVPGLVPAAITAARLLKKEGRLWKAAGLLETAWSQTPHPELARLYRDLKPDEAPEQRSRRMQMLADMNPGHAESKLLMAALQLELRDFDRARETLQDSARHFPTARVCTLMAEIEQQDTGDPFRAREWLSRAARAHRDASWMCDACQNPAPEWSPVCPSCQAFDTLAWRKPGTDILESPAAPSATGALVEVDENGVPPVVKVATEQRAAGRDKPPSMLKKVGTQLQVTRNRAARSVLGVTDQVKKDARRTRERLAGALASLGPRPKNGHDIDLTKEKPTEREAGSIDLAAVTSPEPEIFQSPPAPDDPGPDGELFEERKAGPRPPTI